MKKITRDSDVSDQKTGNSERCSVMNKEKEIRASEGHLRNKDVNGLLTGCSQNASKFSNRNYAAYLSHEL